MPSTTVASSRRLVTALFLVLVVGALAPGLPTARAQDLPGDVYSLSGNVTDDAGDPLADATVELVPADGEPRKTSTDADGAYAFEGLAAGNYTVRASHRCCSDAFGDINVGGTTLQHDVDLVLTRPAEAGEPVVVTGRVIDSETDAGVSGVEITFENHYDAKSEMDSGGSSDADRAIAPGEPHPDHERGYDRVVVRTGADGSYEVELRAGYVNLRADHPDYDRTHGGFDVLADVEIDIPLRPSSVNTVVLSGTLVSDTGEPISEGSVNVGPYYEPQCDGNVCYATEPAYACEGGGDGRFWFECRSGGWDHTQTAADGSWSLTTVPGQVRLSAWARDHLNDDRILEVDGDRSGIRIELETIPPDSVTVTGRVLDAGDGSPVANADVQVENQRWGHTNWTQTDDDGRFTTTTKPGYLIVTVRADRYVYRPCIMEAEQASMDSEASSSDEAPAASSETMIMPAPCPEPEERDHRYYSYVTSMTTSANSEVDLDVRLQRGPEADATIQGWVLNQTDGSPVEGAHVTVYNEATGDWGQAETDADGSYKVQVTPGYYTLRVYAQGYFDGVANARVSSGQTVESTFMLTPGESRWSCCWIAYGDGDLARAESGVAMDASAAPADGGEETALAGGTTTSTQAPTPGGQATFQGSGGGLGPYTGSSDGGGPADEPGNGAPGPSLWLTLAAIGAVVLIARRRSR